jgi:Rab GTPase-activating protein 1
VCFTDGFGGWSEVNSMTASCVSLDDDTTVFTGVIYLGSAVVDAPRSQTEINRNMAILNGQHGMAIPVSLSVPGHSEGIVR